VKLSDTPAEARRLAVPAGTDTDDVLADLGFDAAAVNALRDQGVFG
jgi:crotonobetainyl-CoA:carnitine CoA-transferase CaiB-like acyl-CoA transferase